MTPFPQDDEEQEKWKALLGMDTLSAPALSDPAMQPEAMQLPAAPQPQSTLQTQPSIAPDTTHWQALAGQLPDPPTASYDPTMDKGGLILAAFADALLNKGRSIPTLIAAGSRPGPDVDMENYKRQRQHALDQAQVQHLIQAGRGQAMDPERAAIMRDENDIARERIKYEREALAARSGNSAALNALDSDETQHLQQVALGMGADPEVVKTMTGADILKWRPQIGSAAAAQRSQANWNERYGVGGVREQVDIGKEGRAVGRELSKEGREQERVAAQSTIPGWRQNPNVAPTKDTAADAREIVDALGEVEYAANELTKLHGELGKQAALGKLNVVIGADDAAQKVARAQLLHQKLLASERKLQNMGVPQRYELEMLQSAEPQLTSLDGILNAGNVYPTVASEARAQAARRLKVFGYEPDDAPASRETQTPTGVGGLERLPVTGGTSTRISDTPPTPTQGQAPPGGKVLVQLPDGRVGYLPSEAADEAVKRGARIIQ